MGVGGKIFVPSYLACLSNAVSNMMTLFISDVYLFFIFISDEKKGL